MYVKVWRTVGFGWGESPSARGLMNVEGALRKSNDLIQVSR